MFTGRVARFTDGGLFFKRESLISSKGSIETGLGAGSHKGVVVESDETVNRGLSHLLLQFGYSNLEINSKMLL